MSWCRRARLAAEMTPTPSPIDTLTGNLLAEHTYAVESWVPGGTSRASAARFQVGGKGINVSRMLPRLGVPGEALCFPGGTAGAECHAWLSERGFSFRPFITPIETRRGFV